MTEPCAGCNFIYDLRRAAAAGEDLQALTAEAVVLLSNNDIDVRSRSHPDVWSPLEYACHLRDVLLVQRERVLAARRTSGSDCASMGREERAEHDGYNEQDPADVARQLADAAALFSNVLARLSGDDWDRTVIYHYPETHERSLRWVAVHTVHELQHHLLDIRRQL
ncbi:methyltransferase type 12 [Mycobacterium marseillense]|uniref:Methyltransferase type 12 n=1 Tax=Mycobacterium marseillense TaxID=701042 RepID=A0ABN5ZWD1_9MYCO|nr:methyltransferase type 12 [Mycobacterium marseillense]